VRGLSNSVRCVTVVVLAILMLFTSNNVALAKLSSKATKQQTVTTPNWGTIITDVGSSAQSGSYSTNWANNYSTQYDYVDLVNVGDLTNTGSTIAVNTQDTNSSRQNAPALTFSTCIGGTWNQTYNTCSKTAASLGTVTNDSLTTSFSLAAGQRVSLQIKAVKARKATWTTTINVSVTSSQIRAATVTNS